MSCSRGCCATQAEHFRSIFIAHSGELVRVNQAEQKLSKDLAAYRSMVDQGLEPCTTDGAARLQDQPVDVIEGRLPWLPPQT